MSLTLRKAQMKDAQMLLGWKNEEDTRRNSIVTDKVIAVADHLKWLERTLADDSVELYVIEDSGFPIGDVRLDKGAETEISIRMDASCRGRGLATQVIAMFKSPLTAKIRVHNVASMRVFIANGYRPEEYVAEPAPHLIFRK
jgi:RimJ/RimL family protein N-acetyltransferase